MYLPAPVLQSLPGTAPLCGEQSFAGALTRRPLVAGPTVKVHFAAPLDRSARRLRLGLVVPKKLLRTSVRRNTAKRHIREAFRLMQHALPLGDYVVRVVAHERALPLSVWQRAFRAELDQIVHQASVALTRPPSGGGR